MLRYKMSSLFPLISVTICILLSSSAHGVAVMSVDLGSEWMKIAVVSPGKPMEIALNKESKRKTPVAIAFRDGVRLFGEEALNVATRFPENSYHHFLDLIGKTVDHPVVKKYQENFPYHNISGVPGRNTVLFHHKEGIDFTPEELLAMILKQAREIADDFTEQKITDCVITVPVYFNQAERQTMMKVGELADLKVLQLMNVHTAAALNYGAFRRKHFNTTPQNIMLFDMGATDTVVSIISYQVVKTKEAGYLEENPQLSIKGVGYDRSLGGLVMQLKLRDHLAKLFNDQKHKGTTTDIFTSKRAMSKLFKEAGKVMQVLSANPETFAQVEGLIDDIDFKAKVKREAFIALIQDLIDRVRNPVEKALEDAGMTMSRIDQLILVGGATRIPKVQEQLFNVAKKTLGKNLNTDEAPAMGAAYQAAYLSTGFKVKTFVIKESNLFPIKVDFSRDVVNDDGAITVRQVARNLYSYQNPYPLKKVMTFNKHVSDFNFYIGYGDLSHLSDGESQNMENYNISKVKLKGVENALNKHTEEETESKGIKAHFRMDESGIIRLEQAEAEFKKKVEEKAEAEQSTLSKLGSTISNFLSGGSDSADKKDEEKPSKANESTDDKKVDDKPTKTDNDTSSSNGTSSKKETKQIIVKEPIKVLWKQLDLLHMSQDLENRIRKSITKFEEQEKRKRDQDASRNAVESFILETKNKLDTDEYLAASTEKEREEILKKCNEMQDLLDEEEEQQEVGVYKTKLSELKSITRELFKRVREHTGRPQAWIDLGEVLNVSNIFLASLKNVSKDESIFTDVEMDTLEKLINETTLWEIEMKGKQEETPSTETPVVTLQNIAEHIAALDREIKYLLNKARTTKRKPKPETTKDDVTSDNKTGKDSESTKTENKTDTESNDVKTEETIEVPESADATESPKTAEETVTEKPTNAEETVTEKPTNAEDDEHSEL